MRRYWIISRFRAVLWCLFRGCSVRKRRKKVRDRRGLDTALRDRHILSLWWQRIIIQEPAQWSIDRRGHNTYGVRFQWFGRQRITPGLVEVTRPPMIWLLRCNGGNGTFKPSNAAFRSSTPTTVSHPTVWVLAPLFFFGWCVSGVAETSFPYHVVLVSGTKTTTYDKGAGQEPLG